MASVETTTTEKQDSPDLAVEAVDLLAKGKRNIVCGEIPQAVNQLQEACRLLAAKYGETADECGEAYFLYGKALLEMARVESGVLGNALQGVPDDTDEESGSAENKSEDNIEKEAEAEGEDMDKIREQVFDAMGERDEEVAAREKESKKENQDVEMVDSGKVENGKDEESKKDSEKEVSKEDDLKEESKNDEQKAESKNDGQKEESKNDGEKEESKNDEEKEESKMEVEKESDEPEIAEDKKDEKADIEKTDEKKSDEIEVDQETKEGESKMEEGEEEDGEEEEEGEGEGSKEKSQDEDEDDVPNLQLAWEMLELAKIIFLRQEDKEMKLKAAETFLKLGEVGLETEQYAQSIEDFTECLKIQKEYLECDDRLLAETYYQLGLAYSFNAQFDESIDNYRHATKGIETKIAKLEKIIEENESGKGKEPAKKDDPIANAHQEIKDLKEILPDIIAKIEDAEEEKKNNDKVKQIVKENLATVPTESGTTTVGFGESSSTSEDKGEKKEVTNIMHLVRKKRKPEDEQDVTADSKKPRQDESASGDAKTDKSESVTNGNTEANGKEAVNGSGDGVVNGAVNGNGVHKSPEKTEKTTEIVPKTVEDVKKAKEGEEKMETETTS